MCIGQLPVVVLILGYTHDVILWKATFGELECTTLVHCHTISFYHQMVDDLRMMKVRELWTLYVAVDIGFSSLQVEKELNYFILQY